MIYSLLYWRSWRQLEASKNIGSGLALTSVIWVVFHNHFGASTPKVMKACLTLNALPLKSRLSNESEYVNLAEKFHKKIKSN